MNPYQIPRDDIPPSFPQSCVSCAHWGASEPHGNPHKADLRWRWCDRFPAMWSHIDYGCDDYSRLPRPDVIGRLEQWGVIVDQPEATA